jgi:hypothetical protein
MLFFGHIAASLLVADATDTDRATAVAGNLVPDVTDKTLGLLHLTPSRWLAHGLLGFAFASTVARFYLDERRWRGFVLGYAGHLACDLWAGSKVPWLAPFGKKPRKGKFRSKVHVIVYLLPEVVGLPFVWSKISRPAPVRESVEPVAAIDRG